MTALWPDTFVEDANLSFQISTLRKALGDAGSAWIENVPRHGYRFAADVVTNFVPVQMPAASPTAAVPQPVVPALAGGRRAWRLTGGFGHRPDDPHWRIPGFRVPAIDRRLCESFNAVAAPLTAYPGSETGPSLSPDGNQVAFSWDGPREDNHDVYVKLVGTGEPVRLTRAPERDESPSWSPDGQRIAFVRRIPERVFEVFVMPALGGAERRVASFVLDSSRRSTRLSWSPDGKWVAIGGKPSDSEPFGLWLVEIDGAEKRRLTTPPSPDWLTDFGPVFSPDGRRIAFIRIKATKAAIFILPVSPAMTPAGEPVQVVSDPRRTSIEGLAWTPDGRSLVFSRGGHLAPTRLERLDVSPSSKPAGQAATPALRRTCHSDQHRGHWTHGVLGSPPGCEFLEARCDAAWQRPRGRRSSRVHVRRDNALILSGWQASRVHLHTLRFRGALYLRCRRHEPATDDVNGRTQLRRRTMGARRRVDPVQLHPRRHGGLVSPVS